MKIAEAIERMESVASLWDEVAARPAKGEVAKAMNIRLRGNSEAARTLIAEARIRIDDGR